MSLVIVTDVSFDCLPGDSFKSGGLPSDVRTNAMRRTCSEALHFVVWQNRKNEVWTSVEVSRGCSSAD